MNRIWFLYKISHHCAKTKKGYLIDHQRDWQPNSSAPQHTFCIFTLERSLKRVGGREGHFGLNSCYGWLRSETQVNWITHYWNNGCHVWQSAPYRVTENNSPPLCTLRWVAVSFCFSLESDSNPRHPVFYDWENFLFWLRRLSRWLTQIKLYQQ